MAERAGERAGGPPGGASSPPPSLRAFWALGFVVLSLVALVSIPVYFGRQVSAEQARIADVLEPAAARSATLRLLKAQQMARLEGFLQTGDTAFSNPYTAVIAQEDLVISELGELARELDLLSFDNGETSVFERVAELTTATIDWRIVNQAIITMGVDEGARDRVVNGYNDLQRATRELELAIAAEVDEGRRRAEILERRQTGITIALTILALLATGIVGRVAIRYRSLTIERETRRREAVQARREIDALLEATGDGVLGVDLEGRCTSLNRAGVDLLGYTEREITGRDLHQTLFHSRPDGSAFDPEDSALLAAVREGHTLESEDGAIMWRRRRRPFPVRWTLQPLIDGTDLRGGVLTFTDMTEIHEKEEALRRAIRQREDVVSIVSHDLRNPLGVALAAADLLLDLPLDEEQRRRQAQIIRRSGKRMQHLIEDLLDVARIEAGALVVRPSQEELLPILEEARSLFADQAAAQAIRLEVEALSDNPRARVDRDRMMQALTNLLDNALRLTPEEGRVVLSVREEADDALISVSDTGPGIKPELIDGLFNRFAQIDGREGGAAGLGLTIVRGVATAHDGEVTVASVPGEGSVFTLRLPKRGPAAGEEALAEVGA